MSRVTSVGDDEGNGTTINNTSDIIPLKPYDLIVKEEYASLVPHVSEQEYQTIRQSMEDNGQWVPIIVNAQRIILDGYTRFRACKELQIEPRIKIREFDDQLHEKQFIIQINRNRRQLTPFQRVELEHKYQTIQSELAKKRMSEAGKTGAEKRWKGEREIDVSKKSANEDRVIQNYTTPSNAPELAEKSKVKGRVIDISAKNAQVSPATYNRRIKIIKLDPSQEILNKLRIGEMSIHKAYGQLKTKQKLQHQIAPQEKGKSTIINKTSMKTDTVSSDGVNGLHGESNQNEFAESKKESTVTPSLNDEIESSMKQNEDLIDSKKEMFISHIPMPFESLQKDMATVSQITKGVSNVFFKVSVNLRMHMIEIEFCGITKQKNRMMTSTGKGMLKEAN